MQHFVCCFYCVLFIEQLLLMLFYGECICVNMATENRHKLLPL